MSTDLRFDNRVAVVTGAGNGLGRAHALLLASRGAKVVVNDLGGSHTGEGKGSAAADQVVAEIKSAGGEAVASYDSVEQGEKIIQAALDTWGRIDIVVNNAGILRDVSFAKMTDADWDLVYRVHVQGSYKVTKAAWPHLRDQAYGRIVMTASAAGIYGNFGQANYAMAKLGLHGFAQTLALEGLKKNIHVNTIAPIAGSRMTETVMPKELVDALRPELVSPLVAWLAHEGCEENGGLFEVGGGFIGKLRWERTEGALFKLSQKLTPEKVKERWSAVVDFGKSTHPTDVTSALSPLMDNLGSAKALGNEFIDVDEALRSKFPETTSSYDERDLALYALGVGAAANPLDGSELQTVYELHGDGFRALPTFGVVPALNQILAAAKRGEGMGKGLNFGFDRVLHGEQYTELKRPLPPRATLTHKAWVKEILDKGKHALVVIAMRSFDEKGHELVYNELTMLVRGAGGFGGERGPTGESNLPPERAPDAVVTERISENQALLYRLSGDWNPLHADPDFAQAFGFKRPILHGLCTFGYAGRHVVKSFAQGDPRYFKSIKARFADSVFPGETLKTEMWKEGDKVVFRCKVVERDAVVISNAAVELYKEIPSEPQAAAPAPQAAAQPASMTSAIFKAIGEHVAAHPELQKIATVYQFKLKDPASAWVVDLKSGKVSAGETKAECTLELSDANFLAMCTGQADPQKLFTTGKLKISGNVMASQKLTFLKDIDPKRVAQPTGPVEAAPATVAPAAPAREPAAAAVFKNLKLDAPLVAQVSALLQFKVKEPEAAWVVDLRSGSGAVREGAEPGATTVIELADEDLEALAKGTTTARELYQFGKLRVTGDIRPAQKLGFLKI